MVDPKFFKQQENVGQWIDTMVKVEGPSVLVLNAVFIAGDWSLEDESSKWQDLVTKIDSDEIHCVDLGGSEMSKLSHLALAPLRNSIHEIIMGLLYNADKRITITTPYFLYRLRLCLMHFAQSLSVVVTSLSSCPKSPTLS